MYCYLFYSPRCETSVNFIRIITNEKIQNMFTLISIDTMTRDQIISTGMKKTPMVAIRDQNNVTSGVYEGQVAFEWLNNVIQHRRQNMMKMVEMNRKKLIEANQKVNNTDGSTFVARTDDQNGISDTYSYIDLDYVSSKSFMPYGKDVDFKILTFNDSNGKINQNDMNNKISEYENFRKQTQSAIENNIQNQLKDTLINNIQNNQN